MTSRSYYTIIKNCLIGEYANAEEIDKETIRDFLIRQLDMDFRVGDLFFQETVDLRNDIITILS